MCFNWSHPYSAASVRIYVCAYPCLVSLKMQTCTKVHMAWLKSLHASSFHLDLQNRCMSFQSIPHKPLTPAPVSCSLGAEAVSCLLLLVQTEMLSIQSTKLNSLWITGQATRCCCPANIMTEITKTRSSVFFNNGTWLWLRAGIWVT